jgi:hypothetical protein
MTRAAPGFGPRSAGCPDFRHPLELPMAHQPPKESKKKPQHTAKEKKALKQQKKQAEQLPPFIKH